MSTNFEISYDWLTDESEDASLRISVGPWHATHVEDTLAKTVRLTARLSASRLAEWFAANWWRLLWEPRANTFSWRESHRMGNVGHGYVWPDLTFDSDWESIHVASRPTPPRKAEPIRYLNHFDYHIPATDFETGVERFVNGTIARLSHVQDTRSDLSMLWEEVSAERADPPSCEIRILEACMGFDPDEAPDYLLDSLQQQMGVFGSSAIREMAVAYKESAVPHLMDLRGLAFRDGVVVRVPDYDVIRTSLKDQTATVRIPWQRAERAAHIVRSEWNVAPPVTTKDLCELMQISHSGYLSDQSEGWRSYMAGFRDDDARENFRVSLNSKYSTARRFGLVRLVGDHIAADDTDRLLPGTSSFTSRQKFQRAFAQAFLCPYDALEEYLDTTTPDSDDIDDAAQHFDVSPLMVQSILVNKGVLGRETLDDWSG